MKQSVAVLGVPLSVNTDATDPLYLPDVARHVDEVAATLAGKLPAGTPREKLAVMTALTIADELFRHAATAVPGGRRAEARIEGMVKKIDDALK